MPYSLPSYEDVFTLPYEQLSIDDYLESIRHKDIFKYRVKLIRSGDVLEVEIYPIWTESKYKIVREKTGSPTRHAQKNLNRENTRKHVSRLVHANFTEADIWCTFDYRHEHMPADAKSAQKDMQNYIRRLRGYIKANGLPELKYIYVTEWVINEATGAIHAHHHIIMNFRDRDVAEAVWQKQFGRRASVRNRAVCNRMITDWRGWPGTLPSLKPRKATEKGKKPIRPAQT
ncbi:MAG: hypothetical protein FWC70_08190 [Defluviitaleaceae bacterium]|nr:hypothetical protein [Defluviitaleaceae bacterium]